MTAVVVPNYVNHLNPIVFDNEITYEQVIESIHEATLTDSLPPNLPLNEMATGLAAYRLELTIDYLSQAYNSQNLRKGLIVSMLENYILSFTAESTDNASIAKRLISRDKFNLDPNLEKIIEKIDYASKNIFYKYLHNLKKEASGISPAMFFTGLGMLFGGYITFSRAKLIGEESIASAEQDTAITQMSVGAALTITPFIKAGIKTAIQ